MNLLKKTVLVIAIFGIGLISGSMIWATSANNAGLVDSNQPGSVNDPLITKSYVDEVVASQVQAEINRQIDNQLAEKQAQLDEQIQQFQRQLEGLIGQAGGLTIVELGPNQTMLGDPGAAFIVRNGTTVAVSSDDNGIPDVTGGKDIMDGAPVELNHMLLFPREGRGIKSTHNTTVYVMVEGGYTVLNADGTVAGSSNAEN